MTASNPSASAIRSAIEAGRIVATGTPADLKARAGQARFDLTAASDADVIRLTAALAAASIATDVTGRAVRVAVQGSGRNGIRELNAITDTATRSGAHIERFALHEPVLDDVYFQLTGHPRPARGPDAG